MTLHYVVLDDAPDRWSGGGVASDRRAADATSTTATTAPASGDESLPVTERLTAALAEQWAIAGATIDPALLGSLHAIAAGGDCTVALRGGRVVALWPGFTDRALGVAFDVGSTTIAGHLCDLATGDILASGGRMNPQIRFGEDLMSRVSYAMLNDGGAAELTAAVRGALDELLGELVGQLAAGVASRGEVLEIVAVGNPIMHHLLLGIDPTPLGQAPFPLATADPVERRAADLGIDAPNATVYVGPCIAGHVGADAAAAVLAEGPHRSDRVQLLVDVGTNAEIVLGSAAGLVAASSPTGPAFEGAQITHGQRATAGAIERVRIDPVSLEPRYKVIGIDPWSDEAGFDRALTQVPVTGICGSGIVEVVAELFLAGVVDPSGTIVGAAAERSPRVEPDGRTFRYRLTDGVVITQSDVRAIQLAKAALRAGIELLLERAGITAVDEVRLAGAFGTLLSPVHALVLGLVPDVEPTAVRSVGNAAGVGALRALLSASERAELESTAAAISRIETATEARFQEHFVAALGLPHSTAESPILGTVVALPTARTPKVSGRPRRRRRPAPTS